MGNYSNKLIKKSALQFLLQPIQTTVEPRFNEVAGDRPNLFVKWRVRYIENLRRYNEFEGKRPKSSLYRGHIND